jgi:NAD(P)-dependent dehydrogenase (short-subunit alcohol dehydrogenase family)
VVGIVDQAGRLAVVTGANSGTGLAAARGLAAAGASVILAVRTVRKGEAAVADILAQDPQADVQVRRLDLADLSSVQEFAGAMLAEDRPLDLLLNNAGVMMLPTRHETVDGFEMQFGTNFLGHFALSLRLLPALLRAKAPRVVTMSSSNQAALDFDDLNAEREYEPNRAYGRSKLADLLFSQQLARISTGRGWNLLSVAAHPGNASTSIFENGKQFGERPILALRIGWRVTPRHSANAGAAPMLYAATSPDVTQGGYYGPRFGLIGRPAAVSISKRGRDEQTATRLWAEAERFTGVTLSSAFGVQEQS